MPWPLLKIKGWKYYLMQIMLQSLRDNLLTISYIGNCKWYLTLASRLGCAFWALCLCHQEICGEPKVLNFFYVVLYNVNSVIIKGKVLREHRPQPKENSILLWKRFASLPLTFDKGQWSWHQMYVNNTNSFRDIC